MDFGRFNISDSKTRKLLPQDWVDELNSTLNNAYQVEIMEGESFFDVYGEIYDEEFVVITSLMHQTDLSAAPITVVISHDVIDGDDKKFKKVLANLVDLIGVIFDDVFAGEDCEYISVWTENKYKGETFYYKITRENISLTLQAEEILKKGGLD